MDSVVRLAPSGLRFDARRASLLHVDDAAGLLLVVAGGEVAAYSLAAPGAPPRVTRIEEGAPVRSVLPSTPQSVWCCGTAQQVVLKPEATRPAVAAFVGLQRALLQSSACLC